jgi:uncharacterized surface protein with fasciclin (FAS1) repeats
MVDQRRRTILKALGGASTLALGGVGMASARKGRRKGASAEKNLVETAIALNNSGPYAGAFDELIAAVTAAGLADDLSDPDVQLTVFAPVDAGFENVYAADNGIDEAADVPAGVLLYHVTRGRRYASSVLGAPRLRMLTGDFVTQSEGVLNGGQAEIFVTDVEASNGVIHAIEPGSPGVLLP